MSRAAGVVEASKAQERTGWGERAGSYGLLTGRITARLVEPLLDAAGVAAGTQVLDVGTGPGYAADRAAERGALVSGVDIAEELPFPERSFDALVGNLVINHLPRPERAMQEFARVVRPGGRIALSAWDVPERTRFLGILRDALGECCVADPYEASRPDPFRFADDDELRGLLRGAGLRAVEVRSVSLTHHVADVDELWRGMLGGSVRAAGLVTRQPPRTRARIRASVARLADEYRVAGGGLTIPARAEIASGRRP